LYIPDITQGTNNYAIYTNTGKVRLGGVVHFQRAMGDSTKNPAVDAPSDWIEVRVNGTTKYIPVYDAS
jgi:hypothetical protein